MVKKNTLYIYTNSSLPNYNVYKYTTKNYLDRNTQSNHCCEYTSCP